MANNKILGLYNIQYEIDNANYNLTGEELRGIVEVEKTRPNAKILNYGEELEDEPVLRFNINNVIHIKKVRVLSKGGSGLRSYGTAASFQIFASPSENPDEDMDGQKITVENWNEWQDLDIRFLYTKRTKEKFFDFGFKNLEIEIEDYNIQNAYIGKLITPIIQLWIDTAGCFFGYSEDDYKII